MGRVTRHTAITIVTIITTFIQVPLGVILKDENVGSEMIEILDTLHQYIPEESTSDGRKFLERCLLGGDQLTCERARNAQRHRQDGKEALERLEGFVPVAEDWHMKMCFFEVLLLTSDYYLF